MRKYSFNISMSSRLPTAHKHSKSTTKTKKMKNAWQRTRWFGLGGCSFDMKHMERFKQNKVSIQKNPFSRLAYCIVFGTDANQPYLNYRSIFKIVNSIHENEIMRCGHLDYVQFPLIDNESGKIAIVGVNEFQFCLAFWLFWKP